MTLTRDHGGGLDAAVSTYGGARSDWIDLSTGINPVPYPVGRLPPQAWTALPDSGAVDDLLAAARTFWAVPDGLDIVAANGASAIIAAMPHIWSGSRVAIAQPTYNEHAAAFVANGWTVVEGAADLRVVVHPNNPDGRIWDAATLRGPCVIDESFCDVMPKASLLGQTRDTIVLKSFGKFWGLAGARLGFAICTPDLAAKLRDQLGPWSVAGPALDIGARALRDEAWVNETRMRLAQDSIRLDTLVGWELAGGTDLFRTYAVADAAAMQARLARNRIWSRVFPYSATWIRLGLPAPDQWDQLKAALK